MRLGQTSILTFFARLGSSLVGFVATIYFAQVLGSDVLGVYFLTLATVSWLKLGTSIGIPLSITKRVSERSAKASYAMAGLVLMTLGFTIISIIIHIFRHQLNNYLGEPVYQLVILLLGVQILYTFVGSIIKGERLVHVEGLLSITQTLFRVIFQVVAVIAGFAIGALLIGEIVAFAVVTALGVPLMSFVFGKSLPIVLPKKSHFCSIIDFAKFSWLNELKGSTFNMMDTIILGFFVPSGLIGVYVVCWNISSILDMFSKSVRNVFFPEMSKLASENREEQIQSYLDDALAFSGLFILPGFVGAVVVGRGLLNLYGSEFIKGYLILLILIGATLCFSYQRQFLGTMDALNRPDLSFRVNLLFIILNLSMNVGFVYLFGWIGAAIATFLSAFSSLIFAYYIMRSLLPFIFPYKEVARQLTAASIMGVVVYWVLELMSSVGLDVLRVGPVGVAVTTGICTYFVSLFFISTRFRTVVVDNVPIPIVPGVTEER